ncbi:MAG: tRNA (adenosine(37)-N6)-dimethylallyltransferase MiaA [Muribaculum sp.]|nr:tRNA (adenosine(37)-N6)-dimethylallyltransferase MiaA [Muribaculum sp.]
MRPTLIVITGPTGSGKSDLAVDMALKLNCEIISADSRQIYRGIPIGTAVPTQEQLSAVRHHFIECLDLEDYYSAACFEDDVMTLLPDLFDRSPYTIMCGGSMMYVDAVVNGIDSLPTISESTRRDVLDLYNRGGVSAIIDELRQSDPDYLKIADLSNSRRLIHAVEICREAGVPYSTLRTGHKKSRPFNVVKMVIDYPREQLFGRINSRVERMVAHGLVEEARSVYHLRHLNSLNTVGYKELFAYFEGKMDLSAAIARIQKNTRVYAKKQLTWLARTRSEINILSPDAPFTDALRIIRY